MGHLEHGDRKGDPGGEGFGRGLAVLKKVCSEGGWQKTSICPHIGPILRISGGKTDSCPQMGAGFEDRSREKEDSVHKNGLFSAREGRFAGRSEKKV